MRVITGLARGRKLLTPADMDIRPTADQVKEAIFNSIQFDVEGRKVLDLFAGTGQLGIEALSRGAASAVFVDESSAAIKLVRENLRRTGLQGGTVTQTESLGYLARGGRFDLIFLDPPYRTNLLKKALERIVEFDKLNVGGIIVCESAAQEEPVALEAPYRQLRNRRYGQVRITLYTKDGDAPVAVEAF